MINKKHWAVFINNKSNKLQLINSLLNKNPYSEFNYLNKLKGAVFSNSEIHKYIDLEDRLEKKIVTKNTHQSLKSMSSGERKKALLKHLINSNTEYLILDNPLDNLDINSIDELKNSLQTIAQKTILIQIISRKEDLLPLITNYCYLEASELIFNKENLNNKHVSLKGDIPIPIQTTNVKGDILIALKNISVSYGNKPILKNINWEIKKGEFWQLIGKNGSGKTTILSMITGENSKAYGQNITLFGIKKGSGETIWDIKKHIGYFTPAMIDKFTGRHSVLNMVISGLNDSIGLYVKPTEIQLQLAKEWLSLINMWELHNTHFKDLSLGQQRLIMVARAMIKHPPLLILDEATTGLDDESAKLFVALVNKIAKESNSAILFVSHRHEEGLQPNFTYALKITNEGSIGEINTNNI